MPRRTIMRYSLQRIAVSCLTMTLLTTLYLNLHLLTRNASILDFQSRHLKWSISEHDAFAPKGAWLLSYPTQGSEYLIDIIHVLTKRNTATNYGHVFEEANGKHTRNAYSSVQLFEGRNNGPFIYSKSLPLPVKAYIPVVSHCGGYCINCFPGRYVMTRDAFIKQCVTGKRFEPAMYNDGKNGWGYTTDVQYDGILIHKALHLVRNPFDVVETRFTYISNFYNGDLDWSILYNPNQDGLYSWCGDTAVKFSDEEKKWYWPDVYDAALEVPCHHEFYKLIQWHNYVFQTIEHLNLPSERSFFEDFLTDYENQAKRLLDFYELESVVKIEDNHVEPSYKSRAPLFKIEDKIKIKTFIQKLATPLTLNVLERYLINIPDAD